MQRTLPSWIEEAGRRLIGCAIEVHRRLGPGLLESLYEEALCHEMTISRLRFGRQVEVAIPYRDIVLRGQRLDLIVEDAIVVEIKSIAKIQDVHAAQTLSYLRATDLPLGYLINFNVTTLITGLQRLFNERSSRCLPLTQPPLPTPESSCPSSPFLPSS